MPSKDPAKNRQYVRDHYYRHRDRVLAKVRITGAQARDKKRDFITKLKAESGCAHCGEKDPIVLQFHHASGDTLFAVARMTAQSWKMIRAEIAKCVILCANCHLREHARLSPVSPKEEASGLGPEC